MLLGLGDGPYPTMGRRALDPIDMLDASDPFGNPLMHDSPFDASMAYANRTSVFHSPTQVAHQRNRVSSSGAASNGEGGRRPVLSMSMHSPESERDGLTKRNRSALSSPFSSRASSRVVTPSPSLSHLSGSAREPQETSARPSAEKAPTTAEDVAADQSASSVGDEKHAVSAAASSKPAKKGWFGKNKNKSNAHLESASPSVAASPSASVVSLHGDAPGKTSGVEKRASASSAQAESGNAAAAAAAAPAPAPAAPRQSIQKPSLAGAIDAAKWDRNSVAKAAEEQELLTPTQPHPSEYTAASTPVNAVPSSAPVDVTTKYKKDAPAPAPAPAPVSTTTDEQRTPRSRATSAESKKSTGRLGKLVQRLSFASNSKHNAPSPKNSLPAASAPALPNPHASPRDTPASASESKAVPLPVPAAASDLSPSSNPTNGASSALSSPECSWQSAKGSSEVPSDRLSSESATSPFNEVHQAFRLGDSGSNSNSGTSGIGEDSSSRTAAPRAPRDFLARGLDHDPANSSQVTAGAGERRPSSAEGAMSHARTSSEMTAHIARASPTKGRASAAAAAAAPAHAYTNAEMKTSGFGTRNALHQIISPASDSTDASPLAKREHRDRLWIEDDLSPHTSDGSRDEADADVDADLDADLDLDAGSASTKSTDTTSGTSGASNGNMLPEENLAAEVITGPKAKAKAGGKNVADLNGEYGLSPLAKLTLA